MRPLVLGTRGSALAVRQAQLVQARLEACHPAHPVRLQTISARADREPDRPLDALGGEGVFVKELEAALLAGDIDAAVHSLKDMPLAMPDGLHLVAVLAREEPRDALVSRDGRRFAELPQGARLGTSSLRRRSQLLRRRRDLDVLEIRGNVETRLRKLDDGRYDAIVLAACGLLRLGLGRRITEYLDLELMVPEPGQGALAIEARRDDDELTAWLAPLDDSVARACADAERAFLDALGGGCRVPIAAYAVSEGDQLDLVGTVVAPDGSAAVRGRQRGPIAQPAVLGRTLARQLRAEGAETILQALTRDVTGLRP